MLFSQFSCRGYYFLSTFIAIFILSSCSSPEKKITKPVVTNEKTEIIAEPESQEKPEDLIAEAKLAPEKKANVLLVKASSQYLVHQQPLKALWLSNQLLAKEQPPQLQYRLLLTLAKAYFKVDEIEKSQIEFNKLSELASQHKLPHTLSYYVQLHKLASKRNDNITALDAYLRAFALDKQANDKQINFIWRNFVNLSQWQQQQVKKLNAPYSKGWVALLQIANQYGAEKDFARQLNIWQLKNASHPAQAILANLLAPENAAGTKPTSNSNETAQPAVANNNTEQNQQQHVAVILPLTGQQAVAGVTAQQGVMAAYQNQTEIQLHFIDSNNLAFDTLATTLVENNADFVIGPLLKNNVDKYLAEPTLTLPTLLLNTPSKFELANNQFILSMRPEDEAIQAASILSQQNFVQPVIFSHQDAISERIATAFTEQWQLLNGEQPKVVYFQQGSQMQSMLKETLAVDQSQARINNLRSRLRKKIEDEPRSRRDIDMIYIIGNPLQTRLLKPYIDVNISPFADLIPVFASSRSHSINNDNNTTNDLAGLTFTQMPWLLSSQQQDKALAKVARKLWPQRSDSLERIFAMGYDSLSLMNKLADMQAKPYLRHYGQTGTLQLTNNILTRSLLWGKYSKNKVSEIVME